MKMKVAIVYNICILYWRPLNPSPSHVLWSVPLSFILSSGHLSSGLPFACSARNRPSIVFILSVNGPHIAGHGQAICPQRDGCILRFLQLHFWQTDIWAHLKPGGITFSRLCNVGILLGCKPLRPQTWLPYTHRARKSFSPSFLSHTCTVHSHTTTTKWATKPLLIKMLPAWNVKSQTLSANCICIDFLSGDKYHRPSFTRAQKLDQFNIPEHLVQQPDMHHIWITFKVGKTRSISFISILGATFPR